jgi:hypothetical protein
MSATNEITWAYARELGTFECVLMVFTIFCCLFV